LEGDSCLERRREYLRRLQWQGRTRHSPKNPLSTVSESWIHAPSHGSVLMLAVCLCRVDGPRVPSDCEARLPKTLVTVALNASCRWDTVRHELIFFTWGITTYLQHWSMRMVLVDVVIATVPQTFLPLPTYGHEKIAANQPDKRPCMSRLLPDCTPRMK
jgi:hypothetical protein